VKGGGCFLGGGHAFILVKNFITEEGFNEVK